ncbi:MAG: molybdopterin cofactor-binding domain-containing protein [Acidimicrobiales bacterium]
MSERSGLVELSVNGEQRSITADPETPLLNVLRNELELFGAKRGCAQEQCYACCVLIDGRAQPSCQIPVGHVGPMPVVTVEGLEPLHEFFLAEQVGQCGFCIAGMIVAAQGLLNRVRHPNDAQIREALDTNLCRCGVYDRVRRAIRFRIGQPEDSIWELRSQPPLGAGAVVDPEPVSPSLIAAPTIDAWIQVDREETITVFSGKTELGQGIATAVARIAADELSVEFARIRVVMGDTARTPDEGVTSSSLSVEHSGGAIRLAAAAARMVLLDRAATEFGVEVGDLMTDDGVITDLASGRATSFWELQGGAPFDVAIDIEADVAPPPAASPATGQSGEEPIGATDGISAPRIDLEAKVSGRPAYVQDLRLPDMAFGRVVRPPHYGSTLVDIERGEIEAIEAMPGVVAVVVDGSFVGLVAERQEQVDAAVEAVAAAIIWSEAPTLPDPLDELLTGPSADYFVVDGVPVDHEIGSPATDPGGTFDHASTYTKPFTMHGSLGPSAAVARWRGEELTIWSHSQGPYVIRDSIAEVLDVPSERIRVIHRDGAGCYGHNGADDAALDAALLAAAVPGRPVQLNWSRADEHRWEPYGPAMVVSLAADVADGRITAFDSENWSYSHVTRPRAGGDGSTNLLAGWHRAEPMTRAVPKPIPVRHVGAHRNSDPLYNFADKRLRTHLATTTSYRTSALRGLGAYANIFALESFMDELAAESGVDPIEFRLAHLDDPRAVAVIEAAAAAADWGDPEDAGGVGGAGRGAGIGFARYKNQQTYLATIVEVTVDDGAGEITIDRATIAADCGRIISPDGVSNQLEGGCVQAASWTLKEAVRWSPDGLLSDDWESYPILRFSESFPIRTILLDRPDQRPLGCGEAAQGPTGAAIANAVYAATGARLRDIPLTSDRVRRHLAELSQHPPRQEPAG